MPVSGSSDPGDDGLGVQPWVWSELGQGPRQTSAFIQQLRVLYQRSLQARQTAIRRGRDALAVAPPRTAAAGRPAGRRDQPNAAAVFTAALERRAAERAAGGAYQPATVAALAATAEIASLREARRVAAGAGGGADDPCPMLSDEELIDEEEEEEEEEGDAPQDWQGLPGLLDLAAARDAILFGSNMEGVTAAAAGAAATGPTRALPASACVPPNPCSFLSPGMKFTGSQRLTQAGSRRREEDWQVHVDIQSVDYSSGSVSGTMKALNVPGTKSAIVTCWEGHMVNDREQSFYTRAWGATRETDLRHWGRFDGFSDIRSLVVRHQGQCGCLASYPYIYMRWKEKFFVNVAADCGLTIAGFYYVALCRKTGRIRGFYYDPNSSPFQELDLQVDLGGRAGFTFSSCSLR